MTAAQRSTSCRFIEEVQMGSTRSKQRFNAKGKGKKKKSTLKNKKKKNDQMQTHISYIA